MRLLLLLPLLAFLFAAPAPAPAQDEPEWRTAIEVDVLLHPFSYEPRLIHLAAGRPVRLHLVNNGPIALDFSAPAFFRAARVHPRDAAALADGRVRVRPSEERTVELVPAPGRYRARSTNLLHRIRGMHAVILVD